MNFLQRLFSQPKAESQQVGQPEPVVSGQLGQSDLEHLPPGIHVGKFSDVGQVRDRNEDSLLTIEAFVQHNYGLEPFGLFIVADGMGGHESGEIASATAIRETANCILTEIYLPYLTNNNQASGNRPINEVLIEAVDLANQMVQKVAPDGGTTLTAALVMGNSAYIVHIGDSRAYYLKDNVLKQITTDHSVAQRLREVGDVTPEQIAQNEYILYKAIGQTGPIEVDTCFQHLPPGSSLLICSDGLWKGLDDDTIKDVIKNSITPQQSCERLVAIANENDGDDNITIIVISMGVEAST